MGPGTPMVFKLSAAYNSEFPSDCMLGLPTPLHPIRGGISESDWQPFVAFKSVSRFSWAKTFPLRTLKLPV